MVKFKLPFGGEIIFLLKIIKMGGIDQGLVIRILVLTMRHCWISGYPRALRHSWIYCSIHSTPEHFCVSGIFLDASLPDLLLGFFSVTSVILFCVSWIVCFCCFFVFDARRCVDASPLSSFKLKRREESTE